MTYMYYGDETISRNIVMLDKKWHMYYGDETSYSVK